MNIIEINRKNLKLTQMILNFMGSIKYWGIDCFKYRKITSKNQDLKNTCQLNTCYILGNGPSLKSVDISLLQGKDVITVNKSIKTNLFEQVKPKYHVVIDKYILEEISEDIERELQRTDSSTIFILHRSAIKRFQKYNRARFVYGTKMASRTQAFCNDMTKNMTTFLNVLPFAVSCAMYIGYENIILLGNDFSFFAARKDQHFYDVEENKKRVESLYSDLAGCSIVLTEYRTLYEYAKRKGINVVNATEGSLLYEIPQVKLEDYI